MAGEGIVIMKPTSVSVASGSASITTNGAINFTSSSVLYIDGVFTSNYDNYHILFRTTTNSTAGNYRLRVAGVSASAAQYASFNTQVNGANTPTGGISATAGSSGTFCDTAQQGIAESYFFGPAQAQPTVTFHYGNRDGGGNFTLIQNGSSIHSPSIAYDGLEIILNSNTSGQITIYGLEK